jgi:hypothetical protein
MRRILILSALCAGLALSACSKAEQEDTKADLSAAADKVAAETKELANDPKLKEAGADLKDAATEAGDKVKNATGDALQKAGAEIKDAAHDTEKAADKAAEDMKN